MTSQKLIEKLISENVEPEIRVTKIGNKWHARLLYGEEVRSEMSCDDRADIGWISRELLRMDDKMGGTSKFASAARSRQTGGPVGKVRRIDLAAKRGL